MEKITAQIEEIVNRETLAWDTQNVELLLSIFHPDMVWPWPKSPKHHNPVDWLLTQGRFNYERWTDNYTKFFDEAYLSHNIRKIEKITVSEERDGAFAVVDIDTLWVNKYTGKQSLWKGRVCKVYSKVGSEWKMIAHTGVLDYD